MTSNRKTLFMGLGAGILVTVAGGLLMGQGIRQPGDTMRPGMDADSGNYFVTGDSTRAVLWKRDGNSLRKVGDGDSTDDPMRRDRDPLRPNMPRNPNDPNNPNHPSNPNDPDSPRTPGTPSNPSPRNPTNPR
ncbi:MAG: hypothetical protein SFY69_13170 [Planctomycetota bacterium]|nr:hypothetical protein [Planctomycetota bacterium]